MNILITFLLWILYSFFEGKREALYFSVKSIATQSFDTGNEHAMFTIQRAIVAAIALSLMWFGGSGISTCVYVLASMMLCFPFVHDGEYYVERKKLRGVSSQLYSQGWFSQSTTSTAWMDRLNLLGPVQRTFYFIAGTGIAIFEIINNWK
jgi:hypothetical protein